MKIQIDTEENKKSWRERRAEKHSSFYLFVAIAILLFALLYVYGYMIYHE